MNIDDISKDIRIIETFRQSMEKEKDDFLKRLERNFSPMLAAAKTIDADRITPNASTLGQLKDMLENEKDEFLKRLGNNFSTIIEGQIKELAEIEKKHEALTLARAKLKSKPTQS